MSQYIVPDEFKNEKPSELLAAAGLSAGTESLAQGISASYGIISYKGKVWSLRYRGQSYIFTDPQTGYQSPFLDVVILKQSEGLSKAYYPNRNGFTEGSHERPTCASIDGIVPDEGVPVKQSDFCAICDHNQWKTDASGRRGKECDDQKRLAVMIWPAQAEAVMGSPLMEPVYLKVPPASLINLAEMAKIMERLNYHFNNYKTRITFDPEKSHPVLVFRGTKRLTEEEIPAVIELRNDLLSDQIVGGRNPRLALAAPAPTRTLPPTMSLQPPAEIGYIDGRPISRQALPPKPAPLQVGDVGKAEESSNELDAKIAALIGKGK